MTLLDILAALTRANEEQRLGMTPKQIARLASRQYSRECQAIPKFLRGTLSYRDSTGDTACSRVDAQTKRKRAA